MAEQSAPGLCARVVINYRLTGHTYAVPVADVLELVERAAAGCVSAGGMMWRG